MKEAILKLRLDGKTYNEIKKILGCSKSVISFHCRKNDLSNYNTFTKITDDIINQFQDYYDKCGSSIKTSKHFNVSKSTILKYIIVKPKKTDIEVKYQKSRSVIDWRRRKKQELVKYKGGKCSECGYDKCLSALEFHHLNPKEKDFTVSGKSWGVEKLKKEVDKCILVCANCHIELHENIRKQK